MILSACVFVRTERTALIPPLQTIGTREDVAVVRKQTSDYLKRAKKQLLS